MKMRKITEQECIEELYRVTGIHPNQIITNKEMEFNCNFPFLVEEIDIDIDIEDFDGVLLDYEDVKATLFGRDLIINTTIKADSLQFALEQVKKTVNELESKNLALNVSDGVLVYFTTNSNAKILDITEIIEMFDISIDSIILPISVIFGSRFDNMLKDGYLNIDIFVSYRKNTCKYANNIDY